MFFTAVALLVFCLLSIRWQVYLPVALIWIAVALILGTIVYQILTIELSFSYAKVVLLEIVVTCVVFHLIYQIPNYGLYGADAYGDMASAKGILSSGFVMGAPQYINRNSNFPIIHIFGAILSTITGIDLFSVAKWFPSFLAVACIPFLYLLIHSIFEERKIALLSVLLFACLQNYIFFGSLFIRETYALVLAVCCIYLYFSARRSSNPSTYYALSILCLILTVIAHHLTAFMLLIFLSIHLFVTQMSEVPFLRKAYFGDNIKGEKITTAFGLIALTAIFAYWTFLAPHPFMILVNVLQSMFNQSQWGIQTYSQMSGISGTSIKTIYGYVTYYGFYFFLVVFSLLLLYGLFHKARNRRVEAHSFTLYLFFCLFAAFLSLYVIPSAVYPDRFLTFGWLFGFAPLTLIILRGKSRWFRRIGVFLLVASMLFNIYMVPPALWNPRSSNTSVTIVEEFAPSMEDYALANTFNFTTGTMNAPQNSLMAIYDVQNILRPSPTSSEVNLTNFNWIIVQKHQNITTLTTLSNFIDYNRIYDSSGLSVFKR